MFGGCCWIFNNAGLIRVSPMVIDDSDGSLTKRHFLFTLPEKIKRVYDENFHETSIIES